MFFKEWGSLRGKTHPAYVEQSETKRHGLVQKNVVFPLNPKSPAKEPTS